jgi:nicotinate dehydrogenase subunit B
MTTWAPDELDIEVERYELFENRAAWETTRRDFFRVVGGGLAIALLWRQPAFAQQPGRSGGRGGGGQRPQEIGAWLHIAEDGAVTAYTGKVEIGQNIRTSLSQVVAEELRLPVSRIQMVMADTARVPFDNGTSGSQTTPMMASQLRRVAAAAREKLIDLAAEKANGEREKFKVADGKVVGPSQSFTFGELTQGKKMMQVVAATTSATPARKWTVAGAPVPKVDGRAFVTGSHEYASDIRRPGMLFGKILRPSAFKAKLKSVNTKDAEVLEDVKVVHEGDFVGVVAPTVQAATEALAAIKAEWQTVPQVAAADLFKHLKEQRGGGAARGGGGGFGGGGTTRKGSIPEALKAAVFTVKATYTIAYIAHVPLEPRVAAAEFIDGKLTVWTGTQRPFGVRGEVATAVNMPVESVRVIVPDMGSGYGGKHTGEAAVEAARLAKAVGKPVQVAWTREEEFTWAYFRPAGVIDITAGVAKDGTLTVWEFHNYNSGGSSIRTPYEAANQQIEFHATDSPLRQGSYRALASTANTFARESVMDDLAVAAGLDPLEFRLKNLKDERLRAVLEAAAAKFGWRAGGDNPPRNGHGFGLACGTDKNSVVATCCEIAVDAKGDVKVVRAVTAFECGAILNPDHLKNQVEGGVTMGIGGALFEHIDFADGKILNPSFADYRLPRFKDAPVQEVILLDRKDEPSTGAGETPIIAIAPAIGNAIRAATGVRLRSLPLVPDGFKAP